MGKLRILSAKEVCAILRNHGFEEVRRRGSHIIMQKRTTSETITVPILNYYELRIGTLQSNIRQSGLDRREFEWCEHNRGRFRKTPAPRSKTDRKPKEGMIPKGHESSRR